MTGWQPDWTTLETTAASLIASDPLAALITTVTPVGGYVSMCQVMNGTLRDKPSGTAA